MKTFHILIFSLSLWIGCHQDSKIDRTKLAFISFLSEEPIYLKDSLIFIINEFKAINKVKYIALYSKSMPNRNNILLLTGICGYEVLRNQKPNVYAILDKTPIFLYGINEDLYEIGLDDKFEAAIKNLIKGDTLPCLYNPPNWIVETNKDSIRLYRSIEEYHQKADFYQPTTDF